MKDCILVTGGAGFIGSALSRALAGNVRLPIVAVDNLHPQVHPVRQRPADLHPSVALVVADVCEPRTWRDVLSEWRPSVVVHLAAETGTGQSLSEATRHAHVNVTGTTMMLDAMSAVGHVPRRIVLSSSRAVYGEGTWRKRDGVLFNPGQRSRGMLETACWDFADADALPFSAGRTPPNPTSIYGATKLAQEHIVRSWALSFGAEFACLRLQNVYGPGQSLDNPYTGIVSLFCRLARERKSIPLYEDGRMRRDFVFIDDVARALRAAIESPAAAGEIFDIGTGQATTVADIADWVSRHYAAPPPHVCGAYRHGDVRHAACEIERARAIGWSPGTALREGIVPLCDWIDTRLGTRR